MTLLNTTLQICRGIFKAPGDNFSAENDLFILELQDPAGFSLQVDGWSPNLPALKGGGTWAESAIADGRIPLAQSVGNVTETMRLTMGNGDLQQRFAIFKKLQLMRQSVIDFWDGTAQIDPVYIRWHAAIGKGEQYALIYNLETAQDSDIFNPEQAWDVTLTMEREAYWRGIWPGGNPKEWTLGVVRGLVRGQARYQTANMDLTSDSDHLIYATNVNNATEWRNAAVGAQVDVLSQNYIDIPGTSIPGDAPALLELAIKQNDEASTVTQFAVARSTRIPRATGHDGVQRAASYTFAGGDADISASSWTKVNVGSALGLRSNNSESIYSVVQFAFAAAGSTQVIEWGGTGSPVTRLDRNLLRGTFLVFLRGRITSGAITDVHTNLFQIAEVEDASPQAAQAHSFNQVYLTPSASNMFLHYAGRVTLPLADRATVSVKGYGQQIREGSQGNLRIDISLTNEVAAARTAQICDILFLPIDEGCDFVYSESAGGAFPLTYLLDNTAYLTHGVPEPAARAFGTNANSGGVSIEVRGGPLMLTPGQDQRLYFLTSVASSSVFSVSQPNQTLTVRGNLVPRWAGIRDV